MSRDKLRILMLTKEYPPNVYGGAGVHVDQLTSELVRKAAVEVRCFGTQLESGPMNRPSVRGFTAPAELCAHLNPELAKGLEPLLTDAAIVGHPVSADVVHCHTWYTMMAGLWTKILYGIPLAVTIHSLEPLRPWKEEQLGRGYHLSSWMERTGVMAADAVIAVSESTKERVLECYDVDPERIHVIYNGVNAKTFSKRDPGPALDRYGISRSQPYVLFVGRMTRQKGILHLLDAVEQLPKQVAVVLCAGAPDTPEVFQETSRAVDRLKRRDRRVHLISEMVPVPDLVCLYSGASVFVCPSIYEPFGIINLEAMACEVPVVASRAGGIPEVVVDGETGLLVPFEENPLPDFSPKDPKGFARDLAAAINSLLEDPDRARRLGAAGRGRVEELFSWESIAEKTLSLYERLIKASR